MMHLFGGSYMQRRTNTQNRLFGSVSRLLPACVMMMLLTLPVLMAQEPAAKREEPAATPEEPASKLEAPAAEVAQPKTSKTLRFSWDTTLKYSNAFRLLPLNSQL